MTSGWIKFVVLAALVCVSLSEKENEGSSFGEVGDPVAFVSEPLSGVPVTRAVEDEDKDKTVSKRWHHEGDRGGWGGLGDRGGWGGSGRRGSGRRGPGRGSEHSHFG